jgi:hypothetical protein
MKKYKVFISCFSIFFFIISGNSQGNKIDLKTIPRLEKIYNYYKNIDTKPDKIGNYEEILYLLEDDFSYLVKSGKVNVIGMKEIDVKISSSSFLKDKKEEYTSTNVFDNELKTAWCEGVDGFGFKEWLKFNINFKRDTKEERYLDGNSLPFVLIYPGFGRSKDLFYKNNRVKSVLLVITAKGICDDDSSRKKKCINTSVYRLQFEDIDKYHLFNIEDPSLIGEEFEIYFYIEEVYKGSKYDDSCISEVLFFF